MICKFCSKELTNIEEEQGICFDCLYSKAFYSTSSIETNTKICSKCNEELELSEFYKDKDKYDGYKTICKVCYSKYYTTKIRKQKDKSLVYYLGRAKRKKEDWVPKIGKYYRYRKYFEQPDEETIIMKIISVKKRDKYCVIDFEPIIPKEMVITQWSVSKSELHWTWKYEEIAELSINKK